MAHEYINKLLNSFLKIRQSKIALNQALTLKVGVTLVLTVTQVNLCFREPLPRDFPGTLKLHALLTL